MLVNFLCGLKFNPAHPFFSGEQSMFCIIAARKTLGWSLSEVRCLESDMTSFWERKYKVFLKIHTFSDDSSKLNMTIVDDVSF